jgi:hypothetical protein
MNLSFATSGYRQPRLSPRPARYRKIFATMSKPAARRAIQVFSHGPSCLDGVVAAAAVARFYEGQRVLIRLVANNDSDRVLQELELRANRQAANPAVSRGESAAAPQ